MEREQNLRSSGLSSDERQHAVRQIRNKRGRRIGSGTIPAATHDGQVPLFRAQERLWKLDRLLPESSAYTEVTAFELTGVLDAALLEQAMIEVVKRHEALRTTFSTVDDRPVQVIADTPDVQLLAVDLSSQPEAQRDAEVQRIADGLSRSIFDLSKGPLFHATLIKKSDRHHVLLLAGHHIILDGWSMGIFIRELAEFYSVLRAGAPLSPEPLPVGYGNLAVWDSGQNRQEEIDRQLDYWLRQLEGAPNELPLPVARTRRSTEQLRGGRHRFSLDRALVAQLKAIGRSESATLFMVLLAAFQVLLSRYSGLTDIAVGVPVANRDRQETEKLIGFFVNTLVMRTDFTGSPTFRQALRSVAQTAVSAFEHRDLPFDVMVDALRPDRSMNRNPIVQVVFSYNNTPLSEAEFTDLAVTPLELKHVTPKFDILLAMQEVDGAMSGYLEYDADLFDAATIERMIGHFETLLEGIGADPDASTAALPLVPAHERQQLLVGWNRTDAGVPDHMLLHELFERQAARTPDAPAVLHDGQQLSYAELDRLSNRLAHRLRKMGVSVEDRVGICVPRSPEMVAAVLGVLKAGGAYVPLDPSYPQSRLNYMLADSGAKVVVLTKALAGADWPDPAVDRVYIDDGKALTQEPVEPPPRVSAPDSLAYVLYTSGSTGRPKGVMVEHRNVVHSTQARFEYYGDGLKRFLLLSPLASDSSVAGLFWTLAGGGNLVLPAGAAVPDIPHLCTLIDSQRISHLLCIPSIYEVILQTAQPYHFHAMETVIVAGEPCPKALVERHRNLHPDVRLHNEYGPSEASVWGSVHDCSNGEPGDRIPIGRPISRTRIYLLDDLLQPVPVGVPGQLHIAGAGVGRGYVNNSQATMECFIDDPFDNGSGGRLYRTGDLARYRANGEIEWLGRTDAQIKVNGFRIEPEEVETRLLDHPHVNRAVVGLRRGAGGREQLTAAIVPASSSRPSEDDLRVFLRMSLPEHAIPSAFLMLDELPLLPNGKIDRQATFSGPKTPVREDADPHEWGGLERAVLEIWQDVLDVHTIGPDDDFFKAGGDSLSIIRVHNRLAALAEKNVTITDLFKYSTIRRIAEFLETETETEAVKAT